MTTKAEAFVRGVSALQDQLSLTDNQVASGIAGILITLCQDNGNDPIEFMRQAVQAAKAALT